MNNYDPRGKQPTGSQTGQFGNFGATKNQKPTGNRNTGFGSLGVSGSQKPIVNRPVDFGTISINGGMKPIGSHPSTFGSVGGAGVQKPQHNFWGDIDGDGKETAWDDVLGDGILGDALEAQERARRGLPPEPEDELLIGRRYASQRQPATGSSSAAGALIGVLLVLGFFACMFYALAMGLVH